MFMTSLNTAYLSDKLADELTANYEVRWSRGNNTVILGAMNWKDTYQHILTPDMGRLIEGDNEGEGEAEDDETDPLKKTASIAKIICQNNPSQLNILMQNIAQNDPDLFNLIKEREEEFKTLLEQPINEEDYRNLRSYQREMGIGQGEEHDEHDGHGTISVNLTPEDREVINRLKDLGNFNEADVVQAYFACDKNEEMTANYLFEHMYGQGNN